MRGLKEKNTSWILPVGYGRLKVTHSKVYKRNCPFAYSVGYEYQKWTCIKKVVQDILQPIQTLCSQPVSKTICSLWVPAFILVIYSLIHKNIWPIAFGSERPIWRSFFQVDLFNIMLTFIIFIFRIFYISSKIFPCYVFWTCLCLHKQHHCKPTKPRAIQTNRSPGFLLKLCFGLFLSEVTEFPDITWGKNLYRVQEPKTHCQIGSRHLFKSAFFHQWSDNKDIYLVLYQSSEI